MKNLIFMEKITNISMAFLIGLGSKNSCLFSLLDGKLEWRLFVIMLLRDCYVSLPDICTLLCES